GPATAVPVKTADRLVVMPGFTGLPSRASKLTSIPLSVSSASRPPTMNPFGQVSWYWTLGRGTAVPVGTTTQGPATGAQTMKPRHSFVAPAGAAKETSAAAAAASVSPATFTAAS